MPTQDCHGFVVILGFPLCLTHGLRYRECPPPQSFRSAKTTLHTFHSQGAPTPFTQFPDKTSSQEKGCSQMGSEAALPWPWHRTCSVLACLSALAGPHTGCAWQLRAQMPTAGMCFMFPGLCRADLRGRHYQVSLAKKLGVGRSLFQDPLPALTQCRMQALSSSHE